MIRLFHHRRLLLVLCLGTFAGCVLLLVGGRLNNNVVVRKFYYLIYPEESIGCYRMDAESLPDISDVKPRKGKSIFFHETSCNSFMAGKVVITSRQACAVESAAKWNPNYDVYLLFTSPAKIHFDNTTSDHFLSALLSYKNIHILHLNYARYVRNSLVEELYASGKIEASNYARSHASDVLRYLTLYKYGGVYLDLDVIVVKSFEGLHGDFAGAESTDNVAAGVLGFCPTGIGHSHAKMCLLDLSKHFKGDDWGYNGPGVITRLSQTVCGEQKAKDMQKKDCQGFMVYPPEYFYPVPWWNWTMYFKEVDFKAVLSMSKNSYAVHVWNKHSSLTKVPTKDERIPYVHFAKNNCPKVFNACNGYF